MATYTLRDTTRITLGPVAAADNRTLTAVQEIASIELNQLNRIGLTGGPDQTIVVDNNHRYYASSNNKGYVVLNLDLLGSNQHFNTQRKFNSMVLEELLHSNTFHIDPRSHQLADAIMKLESLAGASSSTVLYIAEELIVREYRELASRLLPDIFHRFDHISDDQSHLLKFLERYNKLFSLAGLSPLLPIHLEQIASSIVNGALPIETNYIV